MLTQEMFVVIVQESLLSGASLIVAVFIVVIVITGSLFVSGLVVFSVLIVDLFLAALIPVWGLTFNNIVVVHLIASMGISVLYSAHITQSYLLVEPPEGLIKSKQRIWKIRVALGQIGSSVLHGSISTLLAIMIVGLSRQSYFFIVFFKLWLGIVLFGMANAFLLIPIILSFVGPTPDYENKRVTRMDNFIRRASVLNEDQISAY